MSVAHDSAVVKRLVLEVGEALNQRDSDDEEAKRPALSNEDRRMYARSILRNLIEQLDIERLEENTARLDVHEASDLTTAVINRLFGLGRLQDYVDDLDNTDIFVNGFDNVHLRRRDGTSREGDGPVADSDQHLIEMVQAEARRGRHEQRWDQASHELNMQLRSGDRLHAIAWVSSRPSISIRRHNFDIHRLKQLIGIGTINESLFHVLQAMILARLNIIVAGGTGAGKTTLLRCLINEIPSDQRLVTVEDSLELGLGHFKALHPNVVEIESREANTEGVGTVSMHDNVRSGLRMGPDRVIVGEIRGAEVVPMLLAMSQGNDGSMSTLHADSSGGVFSRIQMYMAMTPERFNAEAANQMTANAVDVIVHISRLSSNHRVVTSIREVTGADGPSVSSNEIFSPDASGRAMPDFTMSDKLRERLAQVNFDPRWLDSAQASRWDTR